MAVKVKWTGNAADLPKERKNDTTPTVRYVGMGPGGNTYQPYLETDDTAGAGTVKSTVKNDQQGKFNAGRYAGDAGKLFINGIAEGLAATGASVENLIGKGLDKLFPGAGFEGSGLFNALYNGRPDWKWAGENGLVGIKQDREYNQESLQQNADNISSKILKKAAEFGGDIAYGLGNAAPMAAEAMATGGASMATNLTKEGLLKTGAEVVEKTGVLNTLSKATRDLLTSKDYWTSFASEVGMDYYDAKDNGATEDEALRYALYSAGLNSVIEIGGGIQKIPERPNFKTWLKTAHEEGMEEVQQGIVSRLLENAVYNKGNPIVSVTEDNAVINPVNALGEYAGGAAVGGILSGGQQLTQRAINRSVRAEQNKQAKKMYGDSAQDLVAESLELSPNNELATRLQEKLDNGEDLTGDELRQLVEQNENSMVASDKASIQSAVENRLSELGATNNVSKMAEIITQQISGEEVADGERKLVERSDAGQQVRQELNPENIRVGAANEEWTGKIGTARVNTAAYNRSARESGVTGAKYNPKTQKLDAIVTDGDGNIQTVPAEEAEMTPMQEELFDWADGLKLEEAGPLMVRAYQPEQNMELYTRSFKLAYEYGKAGMPMDYVEKSEGVNYLHPTQIKLAYEEGQAATQRKVQAREEKIRSGGTTDSTTKKKGSVSLRGAKVGSKTYAPVNRKTVDSRQWASVKAMRAFSRAVGVDVVFYQSQANERGVYEGANGFYKDGKLYLDINAGRNTVGMTETAILKTAAHELTHFIQANSAQYEALKSFVVNKLTHEEGVSFEDLVTDKQRREPGLEYDEAVDEVVADACEMMLGNSTVVEQLAKENRGLAEKIRDWLREWVENLKIALEGLQADRTESRAMMQYAQELQEIWDNALVDAARNNRGVMEKAAPAESRQSIRETNDGKRYVKADRQVLFGSDPDSWSEQLEDYINGKIRRGQDVQLIAEDGDVLLLTRTSAGKLSDNHTSDGRTMSDAAFERKANAAAHIDELVKVSSKGKKTVIDKDARHGDMASGGWNYRTAYFMDFDGKYYKTTISVAEGSGGSVVYNVGHMKEEAFPKIKGSYAEKGNGPRGNTSTNSIRQSNDNSQEKSSDKTQSSVRDNALVDAARNNRGTARESAPAESRQQERGGTSESIKPGEMSLKGKRDNDKMNAVNASMKEDLENGKARKEDRGAFLRRTVEEGYQVFEGKSAAYGYRSVRWESAGENARQIQKELTELGIDAEIIDGDILWNLDGISSARRVPQATTVEKKKILVNAAASLAPRNTAGHEAFHLWYGLSARKAFEDVVTDNLIFSSKEFLGYQTVVSEAYLGDEADLSDETQYTKLTEEIIAYISGDIHEGVNDDLLRPMFHDYDAVKAAWAKLCKDQAGDKVQNQQRDLRLSDRDVLSLAADMALRQQNKSWTQEDRTQLELFKGRLRQLEYAQATFTSLKEERTELLAGRKVKELSKDEQFELAQNRNRMDLAKKNVEKWEESLWKLESQAAIKTLLRKSRITVEKETAFKARQRYREKTEDRQRYQVLKKRLERTTNEWKCMLLKPTKDRYAPEELVRSCLEVALMLDESGPREGTKSKYRYETTSEALAYMKKQYDALTDSEDQFYRLGYDKELSELVEQLKDALDGKAIRDLTYEEAGDVAAVLVSMQGILKDARYQIGSLERISTQELVDSAVQQMQQMPGRTKAEAATDAVARQSASVMRNIRRMCQYNDNAALYKLFRQLEEGVKKKDRFIMKANKLFDRFAGDRMLKSATELKTYHVSGVDMNMTEMEVMQLILSAKREQSDKTRHLEGKGFIVPDLKLMRKGKGQDAISKGQELNKTFLKDILQLEDGLDAWAKDYMHTASEFFNGMARNAINEATVQTKHRRMAVTKDYVPYEVDKRTVVKDIDGVKFDATIEGDGMLKSVVAGAQNPLIIRGLNTIVENHIERVGRIYGLAVPIRNFNKAYNAKSQKGQGMSMKEAIDRAWPAADTKLIEQAITDLQTSRERATDDISKLMRKAEGKFVEATLLSNISVTIKQAASYSTAGLYLSQKALFPYQATIAKLFAADNSAFAKKLFAEIDEHTPMHYMRRKGMSMEEAATIAQDNSKVVRWMDKKLPDVANPLKWIQNMDVATTAAIWLATKRQVELDGVKQSDPTYWSRVTELYEKVISETQPMYDSLHRPEVQKNINEALRGLMMFRTQPLQNAGILYDAAGEMAQAKKNGYPEQIKAANRKFRMAVGSQVASLAVFATMTLLAYAVRNRLGRYRDDEEEVTVASVMKRVLGDMAVNGAQLIAPIGGGVVAGGIEKVITGSIFGGTLSIPTLDAINDWVSQMDRVRQDIVKLSEDEEADIVTDSVDFAMDTAGMLGIPAKNAFGILRGVVGNITDITGREVSWATDKPAPSMAIVKACFENGHMEKGREVIDQVIQSKMDTGKEEKEARSAVRSSLTAYYKKLYLKAYKRNDNEEMERIRMVIQGSRMYDDNAADVAAGWVKKWAEEEKKKEKAKKK